MPATYSITSLILGYVKTKKTMVSNIVVILQLIMIGGFVIAIAAVFVGPDHKLTGLNHEYYFTITAVAVLGIGAAPM